MTNSQTPSVESKGLMARINELPIPARVAGGLALLAGVGYGAMLVTAQVMNTNIAEAVRVSIMGQ
jgi:hypothetical protein